MAISDDWDFNYSAKVISHIDGRLSYDGGSGTQPSVGYMIRGATSGAIGKVLARTGDEATGTLTLTNVLGLFADGETLDTLSYVDFDNVDNGGFRVGDTIVDQVTGSIDVKFIEYNIDGVAGHGRMFGNNFTAFTNDSQLDIAGGVAAVGVADGVGEDLDADWDADVDGTLNVPGAPDTNNCVIVHFDGGTIAIPEDAHIQSNTSTAEGYAQKVWGSVTTGSIRIADSDTTGGAWTNNEALKILDVEYYDNLVAGKVFSEGDYVKGATSGYYARVLAVIDDGDNTGKLIFGGNTGTPWTDTENIQVKQADDTWVTYAKVEAAQNSYLNAATLNLPNGVRDEQRADQGGIYAPGSLNIVRSANAIYSYGVDLYVQLAQLDDDPPFEGNVRNQLYTVLNSYVIPDLSMRFVEKGAFKDSGNNNIFTNIQTTGAVADIGNHGFFYDTTNPTPQPDLYVEQNGEVLRQDWLEGHLDILIKTKTSTDPRYINPAVEALGQLIDGGAFTTHLRPYRRTYDSNEVSQVGGIAVVALGNAPDLNNTTAQYSCTYASGTGQLLAGEKATTSSGKRVLIVSCGTGATGTVTWNNHGAVNLVDTDVVTGSVTGYAVTLNAAPTAVVAGYSTNIRVMTVQRRFTGGTTTGTWVLGETVTQAGTGATGYFMEDDGGTIYIEEQSGVFNGTGELTGSTASNTPTGTAAYSTVPKDIGGGVGDKNYTAVVSANITGASSQAVAKVYEWWKYITRKESSYQVKKPGLLFDDYWLGNVYRRLQDTYAEVRGASPFGQKAGTLVIGATGVFIEKATLDSADIRSIQLKDNTGTTYDPPNLQSLTLTNLFSGVRVAVYRSTGAGNQDILRSEFKVGAVGAGNNQAGDSTILVAAQTRSVSPLPNDVPDTGVLRVLSPNDTGNYIRMPYTAVNRATNIFTLGDTIGNYLVAAGEAAVDLVANDYAHVVPIEEQSAGASVYNTLQYTVDIPLYVIARVKGKQPFKTTGSFTSSGASIGVVLNPDNVVNLP
jgi:hypothetical protein